MLGQRRRRWANIVPALGERPVFAGKYFQPLVVVLRSREMELKVNENYLYLQMIHHNLQIIFWYNYMSPPFCLFDDTNK